MDLQLAGKTALITGASKGIGRAAAERLAAEGAHVVLVSRTAADLAATKAAIARQSKVQIDTVAADLSHSSAIDQLARDFPMIDILVNNAGAIPDGSLLDVDEQTWRKAWDLKVFGYINMRRAYYALMKDRGSGLIINVTGLPRRPMNLNISAALPAMPRSQHSASPWVASVCVTASGSFHLIRARSKPSDWSI
jgi:hypothetical protein